MSPPCHSTRPKSRETSSAETGEMNTVSTRVKSSIGILLERPFVQSSGHQLRTNIPSSLWSSAAFTTKIYLSSCKAERPEARGYFPTIATKQVTIAHVYRGGPSDSQLEGRVGHSARERRTRMHECTEKNSTKPSVDLHNKANKAVGVILRKTS